MFHNNKNVEFIRLLIYLNSKSDFKNYETNIKIYLKFNNKFFKHK